MANKKNKKKAQQPAPANNAAANSKVEAKKAVAKKNEKAAKSKKNEKPGLIEYTNSVLDTTNAYICNSPR